MVARHFVALRGTQQRCCCRIGACLFTFGFGRSDTIGRVFTVITVIIITVIVTVTTVITVVAVVVGCIRKRDTTSHNFHLLLKSNRFHSFQTFHQQQVEVGDILQIRDEVDVSGVLHLQLRSEDALVFIWMRALLLLLCCRCCR